MVFYPKFATNKITCCTRRKRLVKSQVRCEIKNYVGVIISLRLPRRLRPFYY